MKYPRYWPNPVPIYRFLTDKATNWTPKIVFVLAMAYIISPADFDWVPVIGWVDDAIVGMLALWYVNHATNTWQEKQLVAAQVAKQLADQEAARTVEGSGVAMSDEHGDRAQLDSAQAEAVADDVEAVSIPISRGSS